MISFKIIKSLISYENAGAALVIGSGWGAVAGISASCPGFRFLGITLIVIGVAQLIVGVFAKNNPEFIKEIDFCCYAPLSLTALGLGMFAIIVSTGGSGESIPGRSYKVYHLDSFSKWMQHKVNDAHNWQTYYKTAIVESNVCSKFSKEYEFDTLDVIHTTKLSPFESSCCMPPEDCGFNYTSPTVWVKPEKGGNYTNFDCNTWNNDPNTLCYDCESCKAAFLQDVTTHYFYSGIAMYSPIIPGISLLLCCLCTCCTMAGLGGILVGIGAIFVGIFDGLCKMFARLGTMFSGRNSSDDDNNTSPLIA